MTLERLLATLPETNNLRCDGEKCTDPNGQVKIIPLSEHNNVHLCKDCYEHELRYNEQLELDGKERVLPDLPYSIYPTLLPRKEGEEK